MFKDWTPAELMHATGFVHDLRTGPGSSQRISWAISPAGKAHKLGADAAARAHGVFERLARWRGIDPGARPESTPLALINGQPQDPNRRGYALTNRSN